MEDKQKARFVANKPIFSVNQEKLEEKGILFDELINYIPRYILSPTPLYYGRIKSFWFLIMQLFLRMLVKIFLRPRASSEDLNLSEVDRVYTKEALTYDSKHHLTTRGMDLVWRRMAGWFVSSIARDRENKLEILDLCTGTGLAIKEMTLILEEWGIDANIIGIDYNVDMLIRATRNIGDKKNIRFAQANAMSLTRQSEEKRSLTTFEPNSMDAITQIFGIGGIPDPLKVFSGILRILKPDGLFLMVDMHKPIPEYPGEWPFLLRWFRFPVFEAVIYEKSTIPIVLNRLWGWRDPTLCFYLLPLITYQDDGDRNWGFELQFFEQESQRWWFSLPIMPIGKIIVRKVEISKELARERTAILESCVFAQ